MNSKEVPSIYLESLEILESQIDWSMNRIEYLTKCLDEEREQLKRYKREREKIVQRLKEYGIKLEGENEQRR